MMQHSAVDLENYARLYTEERLRDAARRQRANEVLTRASLLDRTFARVQSWLTATPHKPVAQVLPAAQPAQFVPVSKKIQPASADPYAGMIVLVRGPKEPCTLDAA